MTLPIIPPVIGVLGSPSLLGIPLVRLVRWVFRQFLLLPPALALSLTGTLRTILLPLHLRTRLKKPTTGTATTPFHDLLSGTLKYPSVAQSKRSVKNRQPSLQYYVGQKREHTLGWVRYLSITLDNSQGVEANKVFSHLTGLTIGVIACTDSLTAR